jgi:hypothetical protein
MSSLSDTHAGYFIFNEVHHVFSHCAPGKQQTDQDDLVESSSSSQRSTLSKATSRPGTSVWLRQQYRAKNEQISICKLSTGQGYSETVNETDRTQP